MITINSFEDPIGSFNKKGMKLEKHSKKGTIKEFKPKNFSTKSYIMSHKLNTNFVNYVMEIILTISILCKSILMKKSILWIIRTAHVITTKGESLTQVWIKSKFYNSIDHHINNDNIIRVCLLSYL